MRTPIQLEQIIKSGLQRMAAKHLIIQRESRKDMEQNAHANINNPDTEQHTPYTEIWNSFFDK